jgi:hypothetical protein
MRVGSVPEEQRQRLGILGIKDGRPALAVLDIDGRGILLTLQGFQNEGDRLQTAWENKGLNV